VGPFTSDGLRLVVPPAEQAVAERRGARFDSASGGWSVPAGRRVAVHAFQRWIAPGTVVVDYGPSVPVRLVAIPYACYRCGVMSRPIAGVVAPPSLSLDPTGLVPFDQVGELLAEALDDETLASCTIGPLRWRRSRQVPDGYLANGCRACSTIFGSWHLAEELIEYRAGGGALARLTVDLDVRLPIAVLEYLMGD
jgi:hypothetical protein